MYLELHTCIKCDSKVWNQPPVLYLKALKTKLELAIWASKEILMGKYPKGHTQDEWYTAGTWWADIHSNIPDHNCTSLRDTTHSVSSGFTRNQLVKFIVGRRQRLMFAGSNQQPVRNQSTTTDQAIAQDKESDRFFRVHQPEPIMMPNSHPVFGTAPVSCRQSRKCRAPAMNDQSQENGYC